MKRRIPVIIVLIVAATGFACNSTRTELSGFVKGGEGENLTLERLDVNRTSLIDTVVIGRNGSFDFRFRLEEPELYILKSKNGEIINLLVSPGDKISIQSSYDTFGTGYSVSGSEESEGIRMLVGHLNQTRNDLDSLQLLAVSIGDPENPQMELVRNAYAQSIIKQKRFTIKYLVEHMGSLSSVYALYQKYNDENPVLNLEGDLQYFKAVADSLESTYPNSSLTRSLRADIDQKETAFNDAAHLNSLLEMADDTVQGLLDLSIADRDGKVVDLSSLKGKVTLLFFWASSSNESIKALLQLQPIYEKYHQKGFEVYAVSLDNNKINWMNAIDFNEFSWINVLELSSPESRAALLYNIVSLPTNYLITREGDIVARNKYGRTLETWLENLI
jgi:peroxiredoxin